MLLQATGLHVLHTAVSRGYVEIVQMLLDEYHIDIDLTNTKVRILFTSTPSHDSNNT